MRLTNVLHTSGNFKTFFEYFYDQIVQKKDMDTHCVLTTV